MVSGVVIGIAVLIYLNFLFFSITGHREFIWLGVAQGFFALNTVLAEGYIAIFLLSHRPLTINSLEQILKTGLSAAMPHFPPRFYHHQDTFPAPHIAHTAQHSAGPPSPR